MISNLEACTEPNYIIRLWQNEDIFTYTRNQKVSLIHPFQEVNDQLCFHFLHKNKNITKKKEMGVRMFPQHRGTREAKKKKKNGRTMLKGDAGVTTTPEALTAAVPLEIWWQRALGGMSPGKVIHLDIEGNPCFWDRVIN